MARFLIFAVFLLAAGCSGLVPEAVIRDIETHPSRGAFIEGVPPVRQTRYGCGPAAVSSVMRYYGIDVSPDEVEERVFIDALGGTLVSDILVYVREEGLRAKYFRADLEGLKAMVRRDTPPILLINKGLSDIVIGHYIVVVGYDDGRGVVVALTGKERPSVLKYKKLLRAWKKTDYSTIVIGPGGR